MGDAAAANRSLSTIRTELEYLRESGMLRPEQYESITNQLPWPEQKGGGVPSSYIDPRFAQGPNYVNMPQLAAAAQDPGHPANPQHPKHGAWAKKLGEKLGNAAIFGAGATAGSDLVNSII
ncbi:hypothetical protein IMSHALPRED_002523 [Imshaugia aleurites]|uniref:Uncharacterized protein n=1 Tax=Imshaugia aleurites TaxID=172621 RepID=A0A8H3J5T1_9LECA|nr:hypothetical protein IMSHALPRED_002523 [Imshaugia aleurites]